MASRCLSIAAEVKTSKLPPPATTTVDFTRDIQPIFEKNCLRCHGAEKPKSRFSLVSRESALKGGDNGVDVVPGDSAKSPLIHNVAGLVADMQMPPPGKGGPLTPNEIGLLRAWIDQGVKWTTSAPPAQLTATVLPTAGWVGVSGDKGKFRENEGVQEGWHGGAEDFSFFQQIDRDEKLTVEGHALFRDEDYKLKLAFERTDVGFVRGGFENWRKYYDDAGGYYRPFPQPEFQLNGDLYMDIGRAWVDVGLTLPERPQVVLGYEYQYRNGTKSTLEWGSVYWPNATNPDMALRNIYPATKQINEHTHILKLDITHEVFNWHMENNARVEFYSSNIRHDDVGLYLIGSGLDNSVQVREGLDHVQGMNTFRLERQMTDWLYLSGGYLYSRLDGDYSFNQTTENAAAMPTSGAFWSANDIELHREMHVFSTSGLIKPWDSLFLATGFQGEWTHQEGFGNVNLAYGDPSAPTPSPAYAQSDLDKSRFSENVSLRYTKIPWTVVFAEATLAQEKISQYENENADETTGLAFQRDTDASNYQTDWRTGFTTSPWSWGSLTAHYRSRDSDTDYNNSKFPADFPGYSAFINHRDISSDEVETKLTLKPVNWVKVALTYQWVATKYTTSTDPVPGISPGGSITAGHYDANKYGVSTTLIPIRRLYLNTTFTYSDTRLTTADNNDPGIVASKGDVYTVGSNVRFTLNPTTDLHAAYTFSRASYGQDNYATGLPLGADFIRHAVTAGVSKKLNRNLTVRLGYSFFDYSEPNTGGANNYTAHGVFGTMALKLP